MENPQIIQENKYSLPYHYIPTFDKNNFRQTYNIKWGYEYISYLNFIIKLIKNINFDSLLDIGCGDGRLLSEINKIFPEKKLTGVDYSTRAIQLAKALNNKIDFICLDINKNNLNKKYDIITLMEVLEHIPLNKINNFISHVHNLAANNGYLIMTVPSNNEKIASHHYQHFDYQLIENCLRNYFKIEKFFYINKSSSNVSIISKLLTNKYFILNSRYLLNKIYNFYIKHCFVAKNNNARRICVICKKI